MSAGERKSRVRRGRSQVQASGAATADRAGPAPRMVLEPVEPRILLAAAAATAAGRLIPHVSAPPHTSATVVKRQPVTATRVTSKGAAAAAAQAAAPKVVRTRTARVRAVMTAAAAVAAPAVSQGEVVTASGGTTTYTLGAAATVIDAGLNVTANAGATFTTASVQVGGNYHPSEDQLSLPGFAGGTATFDSTTGTLSVAFSSAQTPAQVQAALRQVAYKNVGSTSTLDARTIKFTVGSASSNKTVQPDYSIDADEQTAVTSAFNVIQNVGQKITALTATPGLNDKTEVPYTNETVTDLLYPNSPDLDSNGNPVADWGSSVQPNGIGAYLQLKNSVSNSFTGAGGGPASLATLQNDVVTALTSLVPGTSAVRSLVSTVTSDFKTVALTLTIANTKGTDQPLDLGQLRQDLGLYLPTPPTISVGGGADIQITVTLDLNGHTAGNAIPSNKVTLNFTRLNSLAGFSFSGTTDAEVGVIRGQIVNGTGQVGATIPVTLANGGNSRTLDQFAADGSDVSGFGTMTGSAQLTLPMTASIGGVSATTGNTKVVVTDSNIFDSTPPTYTATDYDKLRYFSSLSADDIIKQVLAAGQTLKSLGTSAKGPLSTPVPFLKDTTLGDLMQVGAVFDRLIGTQIDVHQPTLQAAFQDQLTDPRLPLSDDSTPKPAAYSDLLSGIQFGVIVNNTGTVHTVTVPADATRQSLSDLVTALNTALTTAGVAIQASVQSNALVFTATSVSVSNFTFVPVATTVAQQAPTAAPTDATGLTAGQTYYFTVTGSTSGTVTGTDYYTLNSPIATAAVHAGILANGQTGVVKVTMVGSQASLWDETRNGITSGSASDAAAYLIESGASDLQKLGITTSALTVLERASGGAATATLPFQADLGSAAKIAITVGSTKYVVSVPDNSRTTRTAALADVQLAMVTAGIPATQLAAQLVDASGNAAPATLDASTDYFLQFYLPSTNASGSFSLAPASDAEAYKVLPIGFTSGQVASTPRPTALRTFEDFENATLFPNLSMTPVYDNVANTVTMQFSVLQNMAGTPTAAGFNFTTTPLTGITPASKTQTFALPVTTAIDFGLEFDIGPSKAVSIASGTSVPANGQLTGDAHLTVQLPLDDNYTVTLPSAWTTANNNVQDLVGDLNLALGGATGATKGATDLTSGKLVARLSQSGGGAFEVVTATPTNGGMALALPANTNGVLSSDATLAFTHLGKQYVVKLAKTKTTTNTQPSDLVADLNVALGTAVLDANANGVIDAGESTVSLASTVFFTTKSSVGGAFDPHVYLYTTDPTGATWPTSVTLLASRTDAAVTQLRFDDGAGSSVPTSTVSAAATGAVAKMRNPADGHAIVAGTINATIPTFAGSTQYGFNKLSFSGASGSVSLQEAVSLAAGVDKTASDLSNSLDTSFAGTMTSADGTGNGNASLTLSGITAASGATIQSNATINLSIPDLSKPTATVPVALGLPIPVPQAEDNGTLDDVAPVNFIDGSSTYTVTVDTATAAGNTTFDQLAAQFNAALQNATVTTNGAQLTGQDVSAKYVITNKDGQLLVSANEQQNNPHYATVTFGPSLSAFGEVGLQGSFGPGTVADGLRSSLAALDALQAGVPDVAQFKLPLINRTLDDLLDVKGDLLTRIGNFRSMDVSSVSQIATSLAAAMSVPPGQVKVSYDAANSAYRVDLQFDTAKSTVLPLDISLADFLQFTDQAVPTGLSRLVDTGNSSPLKVQIKATTVLSLGIDLSDPANPRPFLYGHDNSGVYDMTTDGAAHGTSVDYSISINGTDISFSTSVGALGVFVEGGSVSLGGAVVTDQGAPAYTYDSDNNVLHLATQSTAAKLQVSLGGTTGGKFYLSPQAAEKDATDASNYTAAFDGTVDVNLPLFTPTEYTNPFTNRTANVYVIGQGRTTVNPGGNVVDLKVVDLDAFANDSLAMAGIKNDIASVYAGSSGTLTTAEQAQVDADNQQKADIVANGDVDAFVPDPASADTGVKAPTLLDLLRDPSVLVDGLDSALGLVQTGLQGLDNLSLPIVGPVLGDAVKGIFNFRSGWLNDLKHHMRGAGESAFEYAKEEIYNFLGPSGLNILLQDNGIQSVDGMVPADSADDVTLDFLDADGNKMTGLGGQGADAVEFKVRLGQKLVDTGVNLGFNFDSLKPALSLGINGGLTFKLGWDMTLGFGFSLKDGFYLTTDSDPSAQQMELRFDAGLSGADTGFTVYNTDATHYGIKDANGNPVLGPRNGDGSQSALQVIAVDASGRPVNTNGLTDQQIAATICDDGTVQSPLPQTVYWVVAVDNGSGTLVPAYLDQLGHYRPLSASGWTNTDGGYTDQMVQYNQTAPFSAFGSLFFLNLAAVDKIQTGLQPKGDADYYYDDTKTVTSYDRNNADSGVNRNNELPTRFSGSIAVKLVDPSAASGDYKAGPGPTPTGYMVLDGSNDLGGQPVLDDQGDYVPAKYESDGWHRMDLNEGGDPAVLADYTEGGLITDDESANRITWSELKDEGVGIFKVALNAQAVVNLGMTLSVSDNANFPRITADLNVDWQHSFTLIGGKDETPADDGSGKTESSTAEELGLLPDIAIDNIRLDLGSFLSKLIKPLAQKVNDALQPVDQLVHVINSKIPVLSDIAGHDVTLTTLLTDFGGGDGAAIAAVIDTIETVGDLINVISLVPDDANVYLPLGNFWLAKTSNGPFGRPGEGTTIYYDNSEVHAPSITQRNQSLIADPGAGLDAVTDALGQMDASSADGADGGGGAFNGGGFEFPLLSNPMTVFKLLMGEDAPLVTYSLPKLNVNLDVDIPLVHIVIFDVGLHLNLQMSGQLSVGYDTYGLREFAQTHDPAKLLDGFYVSDRANADGTGADVDEFDIHASIGLYGGVDLYLAKAGIEGGFEFDGSINLNDPNNDGKLRLPEMVRLVQYTGDPLDLADIHFHGDVYAKYYYWVGLKIWTPWHTYTITLTEGGDTFAKMDLFDLEREGSDGPPVYGTMATTVDPDGTKYANSLILNMGDSAAQRISNQDPLNAADGAESFKIWNDVSDPSTVHVQYLNYDGSYTEDYTGVTRVVAHGGIGNDTIDASGLHGLPVEFDGGDGNDTIMLGSGSDTVASEIEGGSGDDSITVSGGGKVRVDGGDGNDSIAGGTGSDTLDPGAGNDTITGGAGGSTDVVFDRSFGNDSVTLSSAANDNILDFTNTSQPITANLSGNASTVTSGAGKVTFNLNGVTQILGSTGDDTFNLSAPQTRNANGGRGLVLRGGPGTDAYNVQGDDLSGVASDGLTIDDGRPATAAATLDTPTLCACGCGGITDIPVLDGGSGYVQPPQVIITDPTGSGARAVAGIDAEGRVTGIYMISEGSGYTNPTVTLLDAPSHDDTINYTQTTSAAGVTLDRQGNGGTQYRISSGGKAINFTGWMQPGALRPDNYGVTEIDNLAFALPAADLTVNDDVNFQGSFTLKGRRLVQNAAVVADTISVTTDRGIQVEHPIQTTNNGDLLLRVTGKNQPNYVGSFGSATASVSGGAITGVNVTAGGNYYDFDPTVTVRGSGADAKLTSTVSNGQLTGINVANGGSGYFTAPAPQIWIAPPASVQINANVGSSTVGSLPGAGDGRGQVTLRADLGAITTDGDVDFPTASHVGWHDGDYVYSQNTLLDDINPTDYADTAGGQGATAQAVLDGDGRVTVINVTNGGSGYSLDLLPVVQIPGGAQATAIVGADGSITGFHITNPGEGYAVPPTVTILSNGFGKIVGVDAASTALNRAHINSANGSLVAVGYYGVGDPDKPLKTDVATLVAQTFAPKAGVSVLEKDALQLGLVDQVNGINTIEGDVSIATMTGAIVLGAPKQLTDTSGRLLWQDAAKTVPLYARNPDGSIQYEGGRIQTGSDATTTLIGQDIDVHSFVSGSGGDLVLEPISPTADIGLNGTTARATGVITDGQLTGFDNFWAGRGYTAAPTVTLTPPGQRAIGFANVLDGQLTAINLEFGGTNYNADFPPIVTLIGGGVNGTTPAHPAAATATFDSDGSVTVFTITDPGSGYVTAPTVNVSLPGTQAKVIAVMDGQRVDHFQIVDPGSNYIVPPVITITSPYPFNLEGSEVDFFQKGFNDVIIGRADGKHTFHAAEATNFQDNVTLRAPDKGGAFQVENLVSAAQVNVVGSGSTTHLTADSSLISGTDVDINDNVIIDDGVSGAITATTGHIDIFGTGKGKIDGATGATTSDLTLTAQSDVAVEGAIGSTSPIRNLTITANTGNVSLSQTNITGTLHITKGANVNLAGLTIGGDLIIDQGATVTFSGAVTVGGNLTITQATSITFSGAVSVTGTIHIPQTGGLTFGNTLTTNGAIQIDNATDVAFNGNTSADGGVTITQANTVSFNGTLTTLAAVTLPKAQTIIFNHDVIAQGGMVIGTFGVPTAVGQVTFSPTARYDGAAGVVINANGSITFGAAIGHATQPAYLQLSSTTGDVSFGGTTAVVGTIEVVKTRHVTFSDDVTAGSLNVDDASGDVRLQGAGNLGTLNVIASGLFQTIHALSLTAGDGTITANNVDFTGGSGSVVYTGGATGTLTIKPRTTSRQVTIGSPPGVFTSLDLSDADLAAIAPGFTKVVIGDAAAGTGLVTMGSVGSQVGLGNSQWVNPTEIYGGAINVVQPNDVTDLAGSMALVARTGNITVSGKINGTVGEQGSLLTMNALAGSIVLNQSIWSTGEIHLDAAGTVTQLATAPLYATGLRVTTGGTADLSTANNDVTTVTMKSTTGAAKFRDDNGYEVGTVDGQSGITATGGLATLSSTGPVTLSQPIQSAGLALAGVGGAYAINTNINTTAAITSASTTTVSINGVTLDSTAGGMTFGGPVTLTGAPTLASHGGDIAFSSTLDGNQNLTLQPAGGSVTFTGSVGGITPLGDVLITSPLNVTANAFAAQGLSVTGGTGAVTFNGTTNVGADGIQLQTLSLAVNGAVVSAGEVHVDANGSVTEGAAGSIKTPGLRVTANGGNIDLSAGNNDATVATFKAGGYVKFHDDQATAIGTVGGQSGITAPGAVTLTTNGHITVTQPITGLRLSENGTGTISLDAPAHLSGSITSSAGTTTEIGAVTLDSTAGGINLAGPVVLTGAPTLASHGGDISFGSTLDGGYDLTLQPTGGSVTFAGTVGGTTPLGVVTVTSPANTTLNAFNAAQLAVNGATGNVTFNGAANIGAGGIQLHAVNVTANAVVHSAGEIHVDASGAVTESAAGSFQTPGLRVTAAGDADLSLGNNDANVVTISSGGVAKFRDDQTSTVATVDGQSGITAPGSVALLTNGHITIDQPVSGFRLTESGTGTITWNVSAHMSGAVSSPATLTTELNGVTVDSTSGGINLAGQTVLLDSSTLASHGGDITLGAVTGNGHDITFQPAGGNVTVNGTAAGLNTLTITSPRNVTLHAFDANQLTSAGGTGDLTFAGTAAVGAGGVQVHAVNVAINAPLTSVGEIHLDAGGAVTESAAGSVAAPAMRVTSTGGTDLSAANNDIPVISLHTGGVAKFRDDQASTVGTVDGQSGITATGAVVLSTAGSIDVVQPIHGGSLSLVGGGTVTFDANASVTGPITSDAATAVDLNGVTLDSTTGGINLAGSVTLLGDSTLASHGGDVALDTVDGADALTINVGSGDVTFSGDVGGTATLTSLVINNGGAVAFQGAVNADTLTETAGTGIAAFAGPVMVGSGGASITAGGVDVQGAFSSEGAIVLTAAGGLAIEPGATLATLNGGNIILTGSTLSIRSAAGSISGTGVLVLQPYSTAQGMTLGALVTTVRNRHIVSTPSGFALTQSAVDALGLTFQRIIVGRGRAGGYDSGDATNAPVLIHGLTFHAPVLVRADGPLADVTIDGQLLSDQPHASIAVEAGDDLTVNANVKAIVSGSVSLVANAAGTGGGDLVVASAAPVQISTPWGDITLEGHNVTLGSAPYPVTMITSKGNITTAVDGHGAFTLANPRSAVYASGNFDVGYSDAAHRPGSVSLAGTVIAGGSVLTHSTGDTVMSGFRLRGGASVGTLADGNLTASYGAVIAPVRRIALAADADGNRVGTAAIGRTVMLSNSMAQPLKVTFNRYVPDTVHKAVSGAAVFTLTNTGAATFTGLVTVRVYSSTDAVFAPDDALVGSATLSVRNLRGGRAAQYSVDVAAFPAKYATRHPYLFVEVLPYGPTVPPTPQPFGNGDANVAVGSILVGAARARRAAVALVG